MLQETRALSYLGDDQGIVEIFEAVKAADQLQSAPPLFHHWVAVALAHLDHRDAAIEQWQTALDLDPDLLVAATNLDNIYEDSSFRRNPLLDEENEKGPYLL